MEYSQIKIAQWFALDSFQEQALRIPEQAWGQSHRVAAKENPQKLVWYSTYKGSSLTHHSSSLVSRNKDSPNIKATSLLDSNAIHIKYFGAMV